jgi:PAS domain S-box-containing protein
MYGTFCLHTRNDKTAEITGFSAKEALGKPLVSTFIVPKLQASVRQILDNALKGEETSNYELEFTTKSNEIRYLLVNATTRCDPESRIVGVIGVVSYYSSVERHIYFFYHLLTYFLVNSGSRCNRIFQK